MQVTLCGLDQIKYNFIGKFENLQEDVLKVVARFNNSGLQLFKFGKSVHHTGSDKKVARVYDKVRLLMTFVNHYAPSSDMLNIPLQCCCRMVVAISQVVFSLVALPPPQETAVRVARIYGSDFDVPLNDIHYDAPLVLKEMMASK